MPFFSAPKPRRTPPASSPRNTFRPRLDALEDRCLLSAGALDPTFGSGGLVSGPTFASAANYVASVVAYPVQGTLNDGKIVASLPGNGANASFGLARYNSDGSLDAAFGSGGIVSTVIGTQNSVIQGLALQSDGKIVAVGRAFVNGPHGRDLDNVFAVARYNLNGSLDTTFGANHNGIVLTNVVTQNKRNNSGYEAPNAIAIQGDGKIIVVGFSNHGGTSDFLENYTLVRYNANVPGKVDGTLDTTFGSSQNGIVVTPNFGTSGGDQLDFPYAVALQPDGKIVVAGDAFPYSTVSEAGMAVVRYTSGGLLDTSFGANGKVLGLASANKAGGRAVLVQSNGAIVVAGSISPTGSPSDSNGQVLARLTGTGQLDTTFGSSGFAFNSSILSCRGIAQSANGDLLVAGTVGVYPDTATYDLGVAAYLPSGAPDTTFGSNGATAAPLGGRDYANAMAIQGDGKIVVEGLSISSSGGYSVSLARFLPPATKIGSFTATPNPVSAGSSVTLTASGILNADPTSIITQAAFYLDDGNGILQSGADILLGYGTQTSPGVWKFTSANGLGLAPGTYKLFAQVLDSNGILSDPLAITFNVI